MKDIKVETDKKIEELSKMTVTMNDRHRQELKSMKNIQTEIKEIKSAPESIWID